MRLRPSLRAWLVRRAKSAFPNPLGSGEGAVRCPLSKNPTFTLGLRPRFSSQFHFLVTPMLHRSFRRCENHLNQVSLDVPSVRPDGDAVGLFHVHGDDGLVSGGSRTRPCDANPPVQSIRPVDVTSRPVHGDTVDRWRRSRQNYAQIQRPVHRQLHQEPVEQPHCTASRLLFTSVRLAIHQLQ